MPELSVDKMFFTEAAAILRKMADMLEQQPDEVVEVNYHMETSALFVDRQVAEKEYHVKIRTQPPRKTT